jgi:hypothetical protein
MPNPSIGPTRSVHLRVPEDLYTELILLRPELQDASGSTKYGALTKYFLGLLRRDLDSHIIHLRSHLDRKAQEDAQEDASLL